MTGMIHLIHAVARVWPLIRGRDFMLRNVLRRPVWRDALAKSPSVIRTRAGFPMHVNPGNDFISMALRLFGNIEPVTEAFVLDHVPPDGGFADIGANVGYFSLLVAALRPGAHVQSFEPNPPIASLLQQSVALNGLASRVKVNRLAVGDREGELPFCLHDTNTGHSRLAAEGTSGDIQVPVVVWDEWWASQHPEPIIHCVKMDIEGAELLALRGMRGFLQRQKPALIVEAYDHQLREFGCTAEELKQFILELGYREARPSDGNFYFIHSQA
ncbi:methyltransferase, FkbM family [Prosthecobacter debontii]|uniref:Methyltransferase, FkbM family n=2 Tax=Prosthecobacter debontii TaxID=48467 RepID=A0A1T4YVZ6_9BACT|nr:methyltransferase, FkbM family [Prosthecobacter debontii]